MQRDATILLKDLAEAISLSKTSCWKRVKKLEEGGYIRVRGGYRMGMMTGLLDGIARGRVEGDGPVLFLHTGGAPALFAYSDAVSSPQ